ncbi:hypothetical protein Zmor_017790 [Zophobas morio]|mgnify:CR=1 FL=1|uniref:Uncharacterized protein n=1 Tax=Zophobas morio TaxID=2755281 RepID=A0AA38IA01_9CUCU|nr:hypothetical protein Zmor_017790 [Zophobas morio]
MAAASSTQNQICCNYCQNPAVKKREKCLNCGFYFHNVCAKCGICCDAQKFDEEKLENSQRDSAPTLNEDITSDIIQTLKWENDFLKQENATLRNENMELFEQVKSIQQVESGMNHIDGVSDLDMIMITNLIRHEVKRAIEIKVANLELELQ